MIFFLLCTDITSDRAIPLVSVKKKEDYPFNVRSRSRHINAALLSAALFVYLCFLCACTQSPPR